MAARHDAMVFGRPAPGHTRPQTPQLSTSVALSDSQPVSAMPSQSRRPASQLATAHSPATQADVAPARSHARPHEPQSDSVAAITRGARVDASA